MTEQETIKVLTVIVMAYPSSAKFNDETTLKGMAAVWKDIFKDDDVHLVEMAVKKHISVNSYPPSVAEIRKQMLDIARPDIIPPDTAWTMVSDVLNTETEFAHFDLHSTFPEMVARVVETIGWNKLYQLYCGSARGNKDGMDRAAFMDLYKPLYEREREKAMLPENIRNVCEKKRKEIGGDTLKLIDEAHQKRIKKEQEWRNLDQFYTHNALEYNEPKMLESENFD